MNRLPFLALFLILVSCDLGTEPPDPELQVAGAEALAEVNAIWSDRGVQITGRILISVDPKMNRDGRTSRDSREIFVNAEWKSWPSGWLRIVLLHELIHVLQIQNGGPIGHPGTVYGINPADHGIFWVPGEYVQP